MFVLFIYTDKATHCKLSCNLRYCFTLGLQPTCYGTSSSIVSIISLFVPPLQDDCLVKVWYSTSKWKSGVSRLFTPPEPSVSVQGQLAFSFIYLAHPRSVTGFSWRKTSKYMPRYGHCPLSVAMIHFDLSWHNFNNCTITTKSTQILHNLFLRPVFWVMVSLLLLLAYTFWPVL